MTTPHDAQSPELDERLNALAQAIAGAVGAAGFLPLSVRYRAAEAAANVIARWEARAMRRIVDVTCPSCGAKLRGDLVDPVPGGPNVFVEYPHRAPKQMGWCHKGTWTVDPATVPNQLELGAA